MGDEGRAGLDPLLPAHFEPLLGERFALASASGAGGAPAEGGEGRAGELELVAVEALPPHSHRAEPFSLTFRGPRELTLPQGTYRLAHPALGSLDVFLVPIRGAATTVDYQAIFN